MQQGLDFSIRARCAHSPRPQSPHTIHHSRSTNGGQHSSGTHTECLLQFHLWRELHRTYFFGRRSSSSTSSSSSFCVHILCVFFFLYIYNRGLRIFRSAETTAIVWTVEDREVCAKGVCALCGLSVKWILVLVVFSFFFFLVLFGTKRGSRAQIKRYFASAPTS